MYTYNLYDHLNNDPPTYNNSVLSLDYEHKSEVETEFNNYKIHFELQHKLTLNKYPFLLCTSKVNVPLRVL